VAPPGLSNAQREQVVGFVDELVATPAWRANLKRFGWTPLKKSGDEFSSFLTTEQQRVQQLLSELRLTG
jgi:putative tricarboxylic transport membrane protein